GETKSQPALAPGLRRGFLAEAVEDVGKELGADAPPGIAHLHDHRRSFASGGSLDRAAGRTELDGVGEQVPEHLAQTSDVALHDERRFWDDQTDVRRA